MRSQLPYRSYRCNRATFEAFLHAGAGKRLVAVVVNPMHHTNSTAITDWAMRKPGKRALNLAWAILSGVELS